MKSLVYGWGSNSYGQIPHGKEQKSINTPVKIKTFQKQRIIQIVPSERTTIFLNYNGEIFEFGDDEFPIIHTIKKRKTIKKLSAGNSHFFILTSEFIYSWGSNKFGQLALPEDYRSYVGTPTQNRFFFEKAISVHDIICGKNQTYFITNNCQLYSCGANQNGQLGVATIPSSNRPLLCANNVQRVFSGLSSEFFYFQDLNGQLFSCGLNLQGQLSLNHQKNISIPNKIITENNPKFPIGAILKIATGQNHSFLLAQRKTTSSNPENFVYFVGSNQKLIFSVVDFLVNKNITDISSSSTHSLAITSQNDVYIWKAGEPIDKFHEMVIDPNISFENHSIKVVCGEDTSFVFSLVSKSLISDFQNLLERKEFTDIEIPTNSQKIPAHRLIIELRIGKENVSKLIQISYSKSTFEVFDFLSFIYSGISNSTIIPIAKQLGFDENWVANKSGKKGLIRDLERLYSDEDSKDFIIIAQEKIKVHRLILIARSDLYRGMFLNVNDSSNCVNDYSGRSAHSIKQVIQFLYLNKIDEDLSVEIVDELFDASEYYQLNDLLYFNLIIDKIRQKQIREKKREF
ncbi:claret isoform a [Anaeramoeba ignava]|uniref:Claret isoform a n=1 Tax=Anaeramoeba ignava TaxID=1746090 RepID=A0A9Q0LAG2_ANAIG|nr:claret isoform a [Anaeramoeba ignava]